MKKRKQPKSLIEYALELFGWGLIVANLYRAVAFRSIPSLSLTQSNWVFWAIWSLLLVFGFFLTPKHSRNGTSVFVSVNSPLGVYIVFSYFNLYRTAISVVLAATGVLLCLYVSLVLFANLKDLWEGKFRGKLGRFFAGFLYRSRMVVGMGLSVIFVVFYLNLYFGFPLMDPVVVATDPKVNSQKISNNIETILLLQEEEWEKLDVQTRLDVLQTVANIEATYLGLPHELNVVVEALSETTQGHYDDSTHTIAINVDHISEDSAHELVETVAHEAHHAYEHRLVDLFNSTGSQERNLLLFNRIEQYRDNFDNYIDGDDDLWGYATQAVEIDSVRYSIIAVEDYYSAIDEHLNLPDVQETP